MDILEVRKLVGDKLAVVACFALTAFSAFALPTITIDSVAQRWPWNNKVDITYTVADGGLDLAEFQYRKIVFTATIDGVEYPIDGSHEVFAPAVEGTHTATWTNAPSGVSAKTCSMVAKITDTTAYYMVVDLNTGKYVFDDLADGDTATAKPTNSDARYNTAPYKTDLLVMRRVPRTADAPSTYAAGYATGDSSYAAPTYTGSLTNSVKRWKTSKDYFIGIFEVTYAQYNKMGITTANPQSLSPICYYQGTWNTLRNSKAPTATLGSNANSGSWFERLNAKTGLVGFDLPTEVMWEIAARSWDNPYQGGTTGASWSSEVGTKNLNDNPNKWGIYDIVGNASELCRDDASRGDLGTDAPDDAFVPASGDSGNVIMRGSNWNQAYNATTTRRWHRQSYSKDSNASTVGFRASFVAQ